MKLFIAIMLMLIFVANSDAVMINLTPRDRNVVLFDGVDTFKAVAKYSVFVAGVVVVILGELKDKPNMVKYGANITTLAIGVIIGDKW